MVVRPKVRIWKTIFVSRLHNMGKTAINIGIILFKCAREYLRTPGKKVVTFTIEKEKAALL